MYIFGGIGKLQVYNHLYRLNLEDEEHEWKLIDVGDIKPPPRASHSAVVIQGKMYIFGGYDAKHEFVDNWNKIQCHCEYMGEWGCQCEQIENHVFNDLWEFNFETSKWIELTNKNQHWPQPRNDHLAVVYKNGIIKKIFFLQKKKLCIFVEV